MKLPLEAGGDIPHLAAAARYEVRKFAELCGVSVRGLERCFMAQADTTPRAWLSCVRQFAGLGKLLEGKSVKVTAGELGYRNVCHFSRDFHKIFGVRARDVLALLKSPLSQFGNSFRMTFSATRAVMLKQSDDENQLTAVTVSNAWRSEFVYDGKMRRRIRYEKTWSGSAWVTNDIVLYVYDGNLVIQERDGSNTPLVSYTRGQDLSGGLDGAGGIGGLLARTVNSNLVVRPLAAHAYYHADANGNITALFSRAGVAVARYVYDPYSNIVGQGGPLAAANLYRFSSKEFHENSGLVYYLYRYYAPNLQRWLNRDPIGELGGRNLYAFVNGSPTVEFDALGLSFLRDLWQWLREHIKVGCKGTYNFDKGKGKGALQVQYQNCGASPPPCWSGVDPVDPIDVYEWNFPK